MSFRGASLVIARAGNKAKQLPLQLSTAGVPAPDILLVPSKTEAAQVALLGYTYHGTCVGLRVYTRNTESGAPSTYFHALDKALLQCQGCFVVLGAFASARDTEAMQLLYGIPHVVVSHSASTRLRPPCQAFKTLGLYKSTAQSMYDNHNGEDVTFWVQHAKTHTAHVELLEAELGTLYVFETLCL